jgi:glycosyltransferase involved in cell wall biosynthesis
MEMKVMTPLQERVGELWVDVGALFDRAERFTDHCRMTAQLAREWLPDMDPAARFCRFEGEVGAYMEVSRQNLRRVLKTQEETEKRRATGADNPSDFEAAFREWGQAARHFSRFLLQAGLAPLRRLCQRRETSGPCEFCLGDVLLLPGATWNDTGACEVLRDRRRAVGLRVVPLIYDAFHVVMPHLVDPDQRTRFVSWLTKTLWIADLVFTVSQAARQNLHDFATRGGLPEPPIAVLRLGDEGAISRPAVRPTALARETLHFVLCVGCVEARRNQSLLYHLWRRLVQRHPGKIPPLVLVGRAGWLAADLLEMIHRDPLTQNLIVHLPEATVAEMQWLYQECRFTLYPSLGEEWGMPVAESLANGKYCIASDAVSLGEIAPGLVGWGDPMDLLTWQEQVEKALFEPGHLEECERRVRAQFRPTPWADTADQALRTICLQFGMVAFGGTANARGGTAPCAS